MRQASGSSATRGSRRGVTLLELIVVLSLLGLMLAVVAPSFIVPAAHHESDFARALETARRAAILRAEPVTLALDDDGSWRIDGDATPGAPPIATGLLRASDGRGVRVRISPLGTCVLETADNNTVVSTWNAVGCRQAAPPAGRYAR
jgi:prepilin-type N-terminal cleavage/methylation domain-containing protein